ncbi:tektin-2 [Thalassophryne amazonica]|uniref:tektin-2 n=1 Tax=Thalassophryne amazonica TaxID=390379 RepID=UPI0014719B8A|nr:tektin-2 [Thalassophryne amazonica]
MAAFHMKPALRHSVPEWGTNNQQLSATAQHERHISNMVQQEGRALRNDTSCKTIWDENETSCRLSDRIWDVARWKEALEACAQKLDEEMEALTLCKEQTEQALAATALPLEVSVECLTLREGRSGYELVQDPVEEQLKKDVTLIEALQQILQQNIHKAFEQLCVLQEARHQLTSDLQNKMEALDIDTTCLSLTIKSPEISLKTDPKRIPNSSSTPQTWVEFSQFNVAHAQEAMQVSQHMREDMNLTRAQLQNDLESQCKATDFALRKRFHDEEQARDELEWQIKNTEDEMAEMQNDIRRLDEDLHAKTAFMKLAHTRLENRTNRSGMDLCRDEVQYGLINEVNQLEATILALKKKLSEAQHSLQKMQLHHSHMLQDLSRKQESLSLEQRSMNTRGRLTSTSYTDKIPVPLIPLTNSSGRSNLQLLAQ